MRRLATLAAAAALGASGQLCANASADITLRVPEAYSAPALPWHTYGNTTLADCAFAAAADWEEIVLGRAPDETEVIHAFYVAGGDPKRGISVGAFSSYWQHRGIDGVRRRLKLDRLASHDDWQLAHDVASHRAVIGEVDFFGERHMLVIAGYDGRPEEPGGALRGVRVVTWGEAQTLGWQEWHASHPRVYLVVHA